MSVINRVFTTDPDAEVAGIIGNRELDVIEQVRYDFPKTWNTILVVSVLSNRWVRI